MIQVFVGICFVGLILWWIYFSGKEAGKYEESKRIDEEFDKELGLPPFWRPDYQHKKKKLDNVGEWNKPLEPGAIVTLPDTPMPWRLDIASLAMHALLSDAEAKKRIFNEVDRDSEKLQRAFAEVALEHADALLKAFRESEQKKEPNTQIFHGVPLENPRGSR